MAKLPYMPFYIGDWRKDPGIQALEYRDRGIWFELLLVMYECHPRGKLMLNGKVMEEQMLARLLGVDLHIFKTVTANLIRYGVAKVCDETGALMCKRMVKDEAARQISITHGRKGGNPSLIDRDKPEANPPLKPKLNMTSDSSLEIQKGSLRGFDEFYAIYPKKRARATAEKAWLKLGGDDRSLVMMAIPLNCQSEDWRKEGGKFIPHPASWLNAKGWLDEVKLSGILLPEKETLTDKWRKNNPDGLTFNQWREKNNL